MEDPTHREMKNEKPKRRDTTVPHPEDSDLEILHNSPTTEK